MYHMYYLRFYVCAAGTSPLEDTSYKFVVSNDSVDKQTMKVNNGRDGQRQTTMTEKRIIKRRRTTMMQHHTINNDEWQCQQHSSVWQRRQQGMTKKQRQRQSTTTRKATIDNDNTTTATATATTMTTNEIDNEMTTATTAATVMIATINIDNDNHFKRQQRLNNEWNNNHRDVSATINNECQVGRDDKCLLLEVRFIATAGGFFVIFSCALKGIGTGTTWATLNAAEQHPVKHVICPMEQHPAEPVVCPLE